MLVAAVMELLVWLKDYLFSERKSYAGRHFEDTVEIVQPDWHPEYSHVTYKGLWRARFRRTAEFAFLRIPAKTFRAWMMIEDEIEQVISLDNWKWMNVPLNQWPEGWKHDTA
jgi:hypothetical protein